MQNYQIVTSNEMGFNLEWFDFYSFAPDEQAARKIAKSIENKYRHIIIINTKTKKQIK